MEYDSSTARAGRLTPLDFDCMDASPRASLDAINSPISVIRSRALLALSLRFHRCTAFLIDVVGPAQRRLHPELSVNVRPSSNTSSTGCEEGVLGWVNSTLVRRRAGR